MEFLTVAADSCCRKSVMQGVEDYHVSFLVITSKNKVSIRHFQGVFDLYLCEFSKMMNNMMNFIYYRNKP